MPARSRSVRPLRPSRRRQRSRAELDAARAELAALPTVAHTAIAGDPRSNQVVLTVAEAADDAAAADLLAAAADLGDAVRMEHVARAFDKAIYGGEAITGGGSRCSAGFNVGADGQDYVVEAGHCTGGVSRWTIGPSVHASFPGNDYGLIRNDTGSAPGAAAAPSSSRSWRRSTPTVCR